MSLRDRLLEVVGPQEGSVLANSSLKRCDVVNRDGMLPPAGSFLQSIFAEALASQSVGPP